MIIDINQFAGMVRRAKSYPDLILQFTGGDLTGAIIQVEADGGQIVGLMGG